jgi:orotidine-5'-phosphate decarboxylase
MLNIILALDTDKDTAIYHAKNLREHIKWVKIGMSLYYSAVNKIIKIMKDLGYKVFLDLKLHDIPHQVELACKSISKLNVDLLTIHASGGLEMMKVASKVLKNTNTKILGITVLTSINKEMLSSIGINNSPQIQTIKLAELVQLANLSGIVCSPLEIDYVKPVLSKDSLIVTPGIRIEKLKNDDQKRFLTPGEAFRKGATHIVVGRPILNAKNPVKIIEQIVESTKGAK